MFGIRQPILLWPASIADRLAGDHIEAILAHELCHVARRDNLLRPPRMVVQTLFWFHPLVWWIGARLVDERERACDESVVASGSEPERYAESILKTCQFFVEAPALCMAGVTGANLEKRMEHIMRGAPFGRMNWWKKSLVAARRRGGSRRTGGGRHRQRATAARAGPGRRRSAVVRGRVGQTQHLGRTESDPRRDARQRPVQHHQHAARRADSVRVPVAAVPVDRRTRLGELPALRRHRHHQRQSRAGRDSPDGAVAPRRAIQPRCAHRNARDGDLRDGPGARRWPTGREAASGRSGVRADDPAAWHEAATATPTAGRRAREAGRRQVVR